MISIIIRKTQTVLNQLRPGIIILGYHRVTDAKDNKLSVSSGHFQEHLTYLKKNFQILNPSEVIKYFEGRLRLKRMAACLTFDDGYRDNAEVAFPMLKERRIPAIFLVSTGWINSEKEFWWENIKNLLFSNLDIKEFYLEEACKQSLVSINSNLERTVFCESLIQFLKRQDVPMRDYLIDQLQKKMRGTYQSRPGDLPMRDADIRKLSSDPLYEVGAHGVSHQAIGSLPIAKQMIEIENSKLTLEQLLGKKIRFFAYPFGTKEDFSPDTVEIVRKAGYRLAFTTQPKIGREGDDFWKIGRFTIRDWSVDELKAKITEWRFQ